MEKIYGGIEELIGKTPLVRLSHFEEKAGPDFRISAKVEFFNPAGSVKDRVALEMINDAEEKGLLSKDTVIIEPTSGNTGIGLCAVCAKRKYRAIIVMPDTMSPERCAIMRAYGAEVVKTDGKLGMAGAIKKAEELAREIPNSFIPSQFTNKANPASHIKTTGPEIWEDTDGLVDIFVAGIGTGGTVTGVGEYLKAKNPNIKIIGAEPLSSPFLTKGTKGLHAIQGIGAGFKPEILNLDIIDEIVTVSNEEALDTCREIAKNEGLLVGISSGAAIAATMKYLSRQDKGTPLHAVVLLPDTGERYLSCNIF